MGKFDKIDQWLIGEKWMLKQIESLYKSGRLKTEFGLTKEQAIECLEGLRPYNCMSFRRGAVAGAIAAGAGLLIGGYLSILRELHKMVHGEEEEQKDEPEESEEEA